MATTTEDRQGDHDAALCFLVGATASGKKAVALQLASRLPFELLSLDSMKVYRGMDRGTDKQAPARFALTNLVEPTERFSVGDYVRHAQAAVASVRARGRLPLFVGGTGLYLRALVRGLFEVPAIDPAVRAAVALSVDRDGLAAAHATLAVKDPEIATRLHPNDRKRIVRALEVAAQTGEALSVWQRRATRCAIDGTPHLVGIHWSRAALRDRVTARVDRMFRDGLVDEVRALLESGRLGPVAGLAIGYRQVVDFLQGQGTLAECRQRVISDTTTFVRRQDHWFRQFPEIAWIDAAAAGDELTDRVTAVYERMIQRPGGRSPV